MPTATTLLQPTHTFTVITSTQIHKKVTQLLSLLFPDTTLPGSTNPVVQLTLKSGSASKLITIVEIVKREASARLKNNGGTGKRLVQVTKVFSEERIAKSDHGPGEAARRQRPAMQDDKQDNTGGETITATTTAKRKLHSVEADESDDEELAFETLTESAKRLCSAAAPEAKKARPKAVLTVFLTMVQRGEEEAFGPEAQIVT